MMSDKVLITGGLGFIGTHLALGLQQSGLVVTCLDLPASDSLRNMRQSTLQDYGVRVVLGDVRQRESFTTVMLEHSGGQVFHLAGMAGVRPSFTAPAEYLETNAIGALNVILEAEKANVNRLFLASSSSVYGQVESNTPMTESNRIDFPFSPYAASKVAMEVMARSLRDQMKLDVTALRFFTVFGPMGRPDMAVWKFSKAMLAGTQLQVYGDGESLRDFTPVDSLTRKLCALARASGSIAPELNLGNSNSLSVNQLIGILAAKFNVSPRVQYLGEEPGDVRATKSSIEGQSRQGLWLGETSLEEGIDSWVEWALENKSLVIAAG